MSKLTLLYYCHFGYEHLGKRFIFKCFLHSLGNIFDLTCEHLLLNPRDDVTELDVRDSASLLALVSRGQHKLIKHLSLIEGHDPALFHQDLEGVLKSNINVALSRTVLLLQNPAYRDCTFLMAEKTLEELFEILPCQLFLGFNRLHLFGLGLLDIDLS